MRVREMQSDDYAAVHRVRVENGLGAQSPESWRHFDNNPHRSAGEPLPRGWVLEDETGQVVGVFCFYPVRYRWKKRSLLAGVAHTLAIDKQHRLSTAMLMAPLARQSGVDFVLTTSASEAPARYYQFLQFHRLPVAYFQQMLCWVVNYRKVAKAALQQRKLGWARKLSLPAAAGLRLAHALSGRNRFGRRSAQVRRIETFDERFDRFWGRLAECSPRLLAMRDRASLQWHFEFGLRNDRVRVLTLENGIEMAGYAILFREFRQPQQLLDRYHLVDLQVLEPRPETIEPLMAGALELARSEGIGMLDVVGLDLPKRRILERLHPYVRSTKRSPYWYKSLRTVDGLDLESSEVWDPTLFDGDATIWSAASESHLADGPMTS